MVDPTTTSIVILNVTATNDNPFQITNQDIVCVEANVHILLNNALYGDMTSQEAPAASGVVLDFKKWALRDLWFRNAGAAANCQVICVAVVPTEHVKEVLGL